MGGTPGSGSGRARRDAAARAMQGWHSQRMGNGDTREPNSKVRLGFAQKNVWFVLISQSIDGESFQFGAFLFHVHRKVWAYLGLALLLFMCLLRFLGCPCFCCDVSLL